MKITWSNFYRCDGTLDRGPYALIGLLGFAIKHNIDRFVAWYFFHRSWGLSNYLIPSDMLGTLASIPWPDTPFLATMAALALPFIGIGVVLTVRRLRAVPLPSWLVVLFFIPFLNILFFILLSLLPSRSDEPSTQSMEESKRRSFLDRLIPDDRLGSAAMALLLTVALSLILISVQILLLRGYGAGLFVGLPFIMGLTSALLYGHHRPQPLAECIGVGVVSVIFLGVGLLVFAIEGLMCIVMSLGLALPLVLLGVCVGYFIQRERWRRRDTATVLMVMLGCLPALTGAEFANAPEALLFEVETSLDITATPETVWRHVVSFSELPPPEEWFFRAGIAYPMRAEIEGRGPGGVRRCVFSTGDFVEPIEIWEEPRLLKFSISSNPPPMQEWTFYKQIHPPHLRGFLVFRGGQFRLIPRAGGGTRLEGTTWYQHHMWPAFYWRIWSRRDHP